jgi:two-component system, NtrC family, sensor kinase
MKSTVLILFPIIISLSAYQQDMTSAYAGTMDREKLKKELNTVKSDSSRTLILTQLAEIYRSVRPDSSFYYGQKALELARRIDYPAGEGVALLALSYYFSNGGDLTQRLELGLKALDIGKKHDFRNVWLPAMIRIGSAYMKLSNYREALRYFQQNLLLTANTKDSFFRAVAFWRSADAYESLNMTDSVLYHAKMAEELANQMGNKFIVYGLAPSLGTAYAIKGNDELATKYLKINKGPFGLAAFAAYYKDRGRDDSAKYYAHKAFEDAGRSKAKEGELVAAKLLASLYELDDPRTALYFQKIVMAHRDSLYGAEKLFSATAVAFKEKEYQNEILLAQMAYRNKIKIYASLAALAVMIFIALLLFRNNRNERKANVLLQHQKEEIARTLSELKITQSQLIQSEKMASLGELTAGIAHEIQNPLNFVNNFSEINTELVTELQQEAASGNLDEVKAIAKSIKENEEKIIHHGKRADAIVKGMLQHSRASSGQKEPTDINALTDEYLRLAYHGFRAKEKSFSATMETEFDKSIGKIKVVPQEIGRVILNLINNAFYAVNEKQKQSLNGYEPVITVTTKKLTADKVEVRVKDNGMGIPQKVQEKIFQPFFTTKPTGQGTGLGLSLSYDIMKSHGGEIKVNTKEGEGSEFIIQLGVN